MSVPEASSFLGGSAVFAENCRSMRETAGKTAGTRRKPFVPPSAAQLKLTLNVSEEKPNGDVHKFSIHKVWASTQGGGKG